MQSWQGRVGSKPEKPSNTCFAVFLSNTHVFPKTCIYIYIYDQGLQVYIYINAIGLLRNTGGVGSSRAARNGQAALMAAAKALPS